MRQASIENPDTFIECSAAVSVAVENIFDSHFEALKFAFTIAFQRYAMRSSRSAAW